MLRLPKSMPFMKKVTVTLCSVGDLDAFPEARAKIDHSVVQMPVGTQLKHQHRLKIR